MCVPFMVAGRNGLARGIDKPWPGVNLWAKPNERSPEMIAEIEINFTYRPPVEFKADLEPDASENTDWIPAEAAAAAVKTKVADFYDPHQSSIHVQVAVRSDMPAWNEQCGGCAGTIHHGVIEVGKYSARWSD